MINTHKHKYIILFLIIAVGIFIFSKFDSKEGYKNGDDNDKGDDNNYNVNDTHKYGSYVAPGGNTVLYDVDVKTKKDKPLGIPRSQIPYGDEDLYILKSEVIPPVCPACPNVTVCANNNNKPPPPCPPCARCPEPAFECKKVPNYNSNNSESLPRPVLADFSQFGM